MKQIVPFVLTLVAISTATGFWTLYSSKDGPTNTAFEEKIKEPEVPILELKPPRTPPSGSLEYRSEFNRFQLFYPDTITVTEYKEKDSARTIVFLDEENGQQFQIFILPYGAMTISAARMESDIPNGTMIEPQTIKIDGVDAAAFLSENPLLGSTREVWFISRGFLYEITSPIEQDAWLSEIMATWMFL